jgi:mono/diheme cytochrome c family protein
MTNGFIALLLGMAFLAGCAGPQRVPPIQVWPDMDNQEKYKAQSSSPLFNDGRSNRRPVEGTVGIGQLKENAAFYTGVENGYWIGKNPVEVTPDLLRRGRQRYDIYCAPCHDRTGQGQGIVPKKTAWLATNLLEDRQREMADGEIYEVISNGRRTMHGYRYQIVERDRWAIVAYLRALQRASRGTVADVPPNLVSELR